MEGPLWELLIPFGSVNKHGRHRLFLFHKGFPLKCRFILAKQFQRRRFLEIDQSKTRIAMFVNGSKRNEQSL
jgi:hypothetical protein